MVLLTVTVLQAYRTASNHWKLLVIHRLHSIFTHPHNPTIGAVYGKPGEMGTKLLDDDQRAAVGPSRQRPCQSLPAGSEYCRDATINRMQDKME